MSAPADFVPFEVINPDGDPGFLLIADHASNALPAEYGDLGLPPGDLDRHIAYDVGVAGVTRHLSKLLNAPAILSGFSRLLIDPNRGEDDPTLVMKLSDGSIIPGNRHADAAEVKKRLEHYYRPYDRAIIAAVERGLSQSPRGPAIISVHSFTPQLMGRPPRPWHIGILHESDPISARKLLELLRNESDLCVGENEPYAGSLSGETLHRHAAMRELRHTLIELRNDLIGDDASQRAWAERLVPMFRQVFTT